LRRIALTPFSAAGAQVIATAIRVIVLRNLPKLPKFTLPFC
jgi:hypothetical protein